MDRLSEIKAAIVELPGEWTIPPGDLNGRIWSIGPICGYDYDALELTRGSRVAAFVLSAHNCYLPWAVAVIEAAVAMRSMLEQVASCVCLPPLKQEANDIMAVFDKAVEGKDGTSEGSH
jgi:hypothetical protein